MANKSSEPEAPVVANDHPTSGFERFLEENLKTLLLAGAVIFIGIMGFLLYTHFSESSAAEEANAFTKAETIEEYRVVIAEYPDSLAAGNAQLMIGRNLAQEEDTRQDGIAELRTFVESYADHPLQPNGIYELGSLLVGVDDSTEAAALFDKLISEYPDSYLTPYAKLAKGDFAYQAGDLESAQKIYTDVLTSHPGTPSAQLAEQRIDVSKISPPVSVEAPSEPEATATGDASTPAINIPPFIEAPAPEDESTEPAPEGEETADSAPPKTDDDSEADDIAQKEGEEAE